MSYAQQAALEIDGQFVQRVDACSVEQAQAFHNDQRPAWVATADAVLRGNGDVHMAFVRLAAGGPGIADKAATPDGGIDQSKVTDADLLSLAQANWPVVAGLFYNEDGSPKT